MADSTAGTATDTSDASNPDIAYEPRDLPLRVLAIAALGVAVFLIVVPFVVLRGFPITASDVDRRLYFPPPSPRLQIDPRRELLDYLSKEQALLGSYGWVDRGRGIARIPISAAMERLSSQGAEGFPAAASSAPEAK